MTVPQHFLDARRERALQEVGTESTFVVYSGSAIKAPGRLDQCLGFQVHPHFQWLTGEDVQNSVIAYDPAEGWVEFFRDASALDYIWDGIRPMRGRLMSEFPAWLEARNGKAIAQCGATPAPMSAHDQELETAILRARRKKDQFEIDLVKRACSATKKGFEKAKELIAPGMTERELLIEICHAFQRGGSSSLGYSAIIGAGPSSIVFHGTPSDRPMLAGEQVLIDMGAAVDAYTADVTRTFAVGAFSPQRQAIYDILLAAFVKCNDMCRPGVEWHDVHRAAAMVLAEGLKQLGILHCSAETACDSGLIALFFPHGIGHLVGLGVRDGTGQAKGRAPGRKCCGIAVRSDFPLEEGFLTTNEPGIYFIPELLDVPETQSQYRTEINWSELAKWMDVGGFRLEDNLLVTSGEAENLTAAIPF